MACGGGGGDGDPTATVAPEATETPVREIQLKLAVEGDFVAPDSHAFSNRFEVGGRLVTRDAVIIGDAAWYREETADWVETTRDDPEVVDLVAQSSAAPDFLQAQDFVRGVQVIEGEAESINGVSTIRYIIPPETASAAVDLFAEAFLQGGGSLEQFDLTVWLEERSGGLVRAEFVAVGTAEILGETAAELDPDAEVVITLTVNLTRINDPDIIVEPPIEGATAPEPAGNGEHTFDSFHYTVDVSIAVSEPS